MNKMIACCGINCETCEARIATMKNDDKMRVEVAEKWCEMNHTDQILHLRALIAWGAVWKARSSTSAATCARCINV